GGVQHLLPHLVAFGPRRARWRAYSTSERSKLGPHLVDRALRQSSQSCQDGVLGIRVVGELAYRDAAYQPSRLYPHQLNWTYSTSVAARGLCEPMGVPEEPGRTVRTAIGSWRGTIHCPERWRDRAAREFVADLRDSIIREWATGKAGACGSN